MIDHSALILALTGKCAIVSADEALLTKRIR
jgi:hypothetical protein